MTVNDFETQFLPLGSRLYRRALAITGNAEDAEDAVQEAYARLWKERDRLERMVNPEGYFVATVRHKALNLLKHRRVSTDESTLVQLPDNAPTPSQQTERNSETAFLQKLIAELPPKAARIMMLDLYEQCDVAEIAELTGETQANVRQILSRSRRLIKQRYHELNTPPEP